jgi:DNA polymerase (family 10)
VGGDRRFPLEEAERHAVAIRELLAPAAERIEIAGSIRRRRPDVGDIELVAIPKFEDEPEGLWGEGQRRNLMAQRVAELKETGELEPALKPAEGEHYARLWYAPAGIQLDLFMVHNPAQWGLLLAIRTGSADFSSWLVTHARRQGFHVADGWLRAGLADHDSDKSPCQHQQLPTYDEGQLFEWLGLPAIPPDQRNGRRE